MDIIVPGKLMSIFENFVELVRRESGKRKFTRKERCDCGVHSVNGSGSSLSMRLKIISVCDNSVLAKNCCHVELQTSNGPFCVSVSFEDFEDLVVLHR